MLQLAGYQPSAILDSGQAFFDADISRQTYFPDTDSNIASDSIAPAALDASAEASSSDLFDSCMATAHLSIP